METKFTKGKWTVNRHNNVYSKYQLPIAVIYDGSTAHNSFRESNVRICKANALLISKSPEMFEEIKESITDLKILKTNILQSAKLDNKWDGFAELVQQWIDRKEQVLKEATEL